MAAADVDADAVTDMTPVSLAVMNTVGLALTLRIMAPTHNSQPLPTFPFSWLVSW